MVERVFLLAGRSLPGILQDARSAWPEAEMVVVGEADDPVTPEGARTGPDRFEGLDERAVLVANGGRTELQVEAVLAAAEGGATIVNIQFEGMKVLYASEATEEAYVIVVPDGYTPEEEAALRAHPAFLQLSALVDECNKAHEEWTAACRALKAVRKTLWSARQALLNSEPSEALRVAREQRERQVRRATLAAFLVGGAYAEEADQAGRWKAQEKSLLDAVFNAVTVAAEQCADAGVAEAAAEKDRGFAAETLKAKDRQLTALYKGALQTLVVLQRNDYSIWETMA